MGKTAKIIKKIFKCFLFISINIYNADIKLIFSLLKDKKVRGFLNVIACCEGTKKVNKKNILIDRYPELKEYKIPFINAEKITSLREYPNKLFCGNIRQKRVCASASGRYQFIKKTWYDLCKRFRQEGIYKNYPSLIDEYLLDLSTIYQEDIVKFYQIKEDVLKYKFGPFWQDFYAIALLIQIGAVEDILNDNYKNLIQKASRIWSTLPKDASGLSFHESHINHAQKLPYTVRLCKRYMNY
jgi:muramidase (phage lysozyme)